MICVILGSLLRNMLGEWEPIYDTYRFVSKGRWGTFFLSFSSIIILVLIFRCFIQYIKKVHGDDLFETLITRDERLRGENMGHYLRASTDNRNLYCD